MSLTTVEQYSLDDFLRDIVKDDEDWNNRECQFCEKKITVLYGEVVVLTDETDTCKECYETVSDKWRGHDCAENEKSLGY